MEVFDKQLIAPCGMNCAICSRYLAYKNKLPVVKGKIYHCSGCRPEDRKCVVQKNCTDNRKLLKREIDFCFKCNNFPCERLLKLDRRYRKNYNMSMVENLMNIKTDGLAKFVKKQSRKYKCPNCDGLISVHNGKCFACDYIKSWKK